MYGRASAAALEACKEEASQNLERVQRELNEAQERAVQRALSEKEQDLQQKPSSYVAVRTYSKHKKES